jgi:flagellar hook-associated protein 2
VLRWTDSTGGTGTISMSDSSQTYEIEAGVKINIAAGDLTEGKDFQINVFAPDKQQGQDAGLAQVAKVVHAGFTDDTSTAVTNANGTFTYTYGGEEVSLSVLAGVTLSQLASLINDDTGNPGVSATIINDGQGLPTSYRLVLTGTSSGAKNQITSVSHDFTGTALETAAVWGEDSPPAR